MLINIHKEDSRGVANHGWLDSKHTYSFASYRNPERMGFGKLLVINDDVVEPSMGFATHPHENMEIISIPLSGSLRHVDSMGNQHVIEAGEVQIMSAGKGITHSEYNNSEVDTVNFLQIWILPKKMDIEPGYGQKRFDAKDRSNQFQLIVSPNGDAGSVAINQDVYFSLVDLEKGHSLDYPLHQAGNGVYVFVLEGNLKLDDSILETRDGAELSDIGKLSFTANESTQLLCIETPVL